MSLGVSLDTNLDIGEEIRFKQKNKKLMKALAKQVHFTYDEVEHLCIIYYKLQLLGGGKNVPVRRSQVKDVLHNGLDMTRNRYMPYILSTLDRSLSPYMAMDKWVRMFSLFLRGTLEEKITYCYSVYRSFGLNEKIIRSTMVTLMAHSIIKDNNDEDEESIKDMIDMIIKKIDIDRDGKICFDEYRDCILSRPLFLEVFGQILPDRYAVNTFKTTFTKNVGKL